MLSISLRDMTNILVRCENIIFGRSCTYKLLTFSVKSCIYELEAKTDFHADIMVYRHRCIVYRGAICKPATTQGQGRDIFLQNTMARGRGEKKGENNIKTGKRL